MVANYHHKGEKGGDIYAFHRLVQMYEMSRTANQVAREYPNAGIVVLGDFNAEPTSLPFRLFLGPDAPLAFLPGLRSISHLAPEANWNTFNLPSNVFASPKKTSERIDHMLYYRMEGRMARVAFTKPFKLGSMSLSYSDHYGLEAEFSFDYYNDREQGVPILGLSGLAGHHSDIHKVLFHEIFELSRGAAKDLKYRISWFAICTGISAQLLLILLPLSLWIKKKKRKSLARNKQSEGPESIELLPIREDGTKRETLQTLGFFLLTVTLTAALLLSLWFGQVCGIQELAAHRQFLTEMAIAIPSYRETLDALISSL